MSRPDSDVYDEKTVRYFNTHLHEYSPERLLPVTAAINKHSSGGASLVDLGCGTGHALQLIRAETNLSELWALDVSEQSLARTRERTACHTLLGSILDEELPRQVARQFDFALLIAVLHHLIGRTRRESRRLASRAIANALHLVRPGGHLLIMEPVFAPAWTMDLVFYLKTAVTAFTSERVGICGYWNNIGAPVVSYYDCGQLRQMLGAVRGCDIIACDVHHRAVPRLLRLAGIRERSDATFIVKKAAAAESLPETQAA